MAERKVPVVLDPDTVKLLKILAVNTGSQANVVLKRAVDLYLLEPEQVETLRSLDEFVESKLTKSSSNSPIEPK